MDVNTNFNKSNETLAEAIDREQFEMDAAKAQANAKPLIEKWAKEFDEKHFAHTSSHDADDCSM